MKSKLVAWMAATVVVGELLLVVLSWLLSATTTDGVRSLLSGEGLRWMAGMATASILSPLLAWLLLGAMAAGCTVKSGLLRAFRLRHSYRHRLALRTTVGIAAVFAGVLLLLTAVPHAVLVSATGSLWPSPFSQALLPALAFVVAALSVCYGLLAHTFQSVADITDAAVYGLARSAPVIMLYILATHFYAALCFVF